MKFFRSITPIHYLGFYLSYIGNKLFFFILFSFLIGFVESIGIASVLPLLTIENGGAGEQHHFTLVLERVLDVFGLNLNISSILLVIIVVFFIKFVLVFFQEVVRAYLAITLYEDLTKDFVKMIRLVKFEYYVKTEIGYLLNLVNNESVRTVGGFHKLSAVIVGLCSAVSYLMFSMFINYKATITVIVFGVTVHYLYRHLRVKTAMLSSSISTSNAVVQGFYVQFVSNYKYLKATSAARFVCDQLLKKLRINCDLKYKNLVLSGFVVSSFEFINVLIFTSILFYFVVIKQQNIIAIVIPLIFLYKCLGQLSVVQRQWQIFLSKSGGVNTIKKARKRLLKNKERNTGRKIVSFNRAIALEGINVSFQDKKILENISLEIHKNKIVGIVGASGAGKTTLLNIIVGLMAPDDGQVFIDDQNYNDLDLSSLRSLFGYVTQEPVLFSATVKDNVTLWDNVAVSKDNSVELEDALTAAGCDRFVYAKEKGLDALVGDQGGMLSGGQKQRLCIAREIYRSTDILIFDEATASLDSESEQIIQESIKAMIGRKTIILVSHRLTTLKYCDTIHVLMNGKIEESGSYSELIHDVDSNFYHMYKQHEEGGV